MSDRSTWRTLTAPASRRLVWRMARLLRPHLGMAAHAVALSWLLALVDLSGPYLTRSAIDHALTNGDAQALVRTSALFLIAMLLSAIVRYRSARVVDLTAQRIIGTFRREVHAHLQMLPVAYFDRHAVGTLMTRLTSDVDALKSLFTTSLVGALSDAASLVAIAVTMGVLAPRLALVTFALIPILAIVSARLRAASRREHRVLDAWTTRAFAFLQEYLSGMLVVQVFGRERRSRAEFEAINAKQAESRVRQGRLSARSAPALEIIMASAIGMTLWYGGRDVLAGAITLGTLVAFIQYTDRFWRLLAGFFEQANALQGALAAVERIFALLDTPPAPTAPASSMRPAAAAGALTFDRVWFAYDEEDAAERVDRAACSPRWAIEDVSFDVAPGRFVALVGATGAGKTTITSLLARFYDARRGRVLVDGLDVRAWPVAALRSHLGLVPQDAQLFTATIADNIRVGTELSDRAVRAAAQAVHVDRFIEALPDGYETAVRERGTNLSVGQRQLLVLARALARDPRILVLDEATSQLDDETEAQLREVLEAQRDRRTLLVVAHRLATITRADEILVMARGRIRERGTHAQLLARRGIYWRLHELQRHAAWDVPTSPAREPFVDGGRR